MSFGALLNLFWQDAMNILGQDEGLSRRQNAANSMLTSFRVPFSHILFGLGSAFSSSFASCAQAIRSQPACPRRGRPSASLWWSLSCFCLGVLLSLSSKIVCAVTPRCWLKRFMSTFCLLSQSTADPWCHPFHPQHAWWCLHSSNISQSIWACCPTLISDLHSLIGIVLMLGPLLSAENKFKHRHAFLKIYVISSHNKGLKHLPL